MEMSISGGSALPAGPALVTTSFPSRRPSVRYEIDKRSQYLSVLSGSAREPAGHEITESLPGSGSAPRAAPLAADRTSDRAVPSFFCCRTTSGRRHPSPHLPGGRRSVAARLRNMNGQIWVHEEVFFLYPERAGFQTVQGQELSESYG
jgi:hypothetical protein